MKRKLLLIPAMVAMLSLCSCSLLEEEIPSEPVTVVTSEKPDIMVDPGDWKAPERSSEEVIEVPKAGDVNYDFMSHNPNEWQKAYYDFLQDMPKSVGDDPSFMAENQYFLADVDDKFGTYIPELCVRTGTCEADYELNIYTFDTNSKEVDQLVGPGVIGAGHTTFYVGPNGNLYGAWGHMGYQSVIEFSDISGSVKSEEVFSEDLNRKPADAEYTTMSEYFGEETNACLELPVSNPAGLIWYLNLPYPTGSKEDQAFAIRAFDDCIAKNTDVYVVSSSPYLSCKEGKMPFREILNAGVIDAYEKTPYHLDAFCYTDVNFDEQDELLLKLKSDGEEKNAFVLLSYQDGNVYAYAMPDLSSEGSVFAVGYSVYKNWVVDNFGYRSTMGFVFDKDFCTFLYSDADIEDPEKNLKDQWDEF